MVAGGPYGIEDILGGAGFLKAIAILLVLPFLWCLPTALMIGELASAIPAEGGFYIWVRRALGPFWGYQEGWLSLSASVFDMAIYPAIFVLYLGKFSPTLTAGWHGYGWSLAVVVLCCVWNLRGAPAVGEDSVGLFVLLLAPFAVFVVLGFWRWFTVHPAVQWNHPASEEAPFGGDSGGDVELHGVGQRLNSSQGGGESAAELSPRNGLFDDSGSCQLHSSVGGGCCGRIFGGELHYRRLDDSGSGTGRAVAGAGGGGWGLHQRHRHVQRAGHELYAPARGDGRK